MKQIPEESDMWGWLPREPQPMETDVPKTDSRQMLSLTRKRVGWIDRFVRFRCLAGLVLVLICVTTAGADSPFYAVHLASFSFLKNANAYVNTLSESEKVVFWREVRIQGKGRFYRVFVGRFSTREQALRYWKKLKQQNKVSYQGIFQFDPPSVPDTDRPPGTSAIQARKDEPPAGEANRFQDNADGTITDTRTGLMWVKNGWRLEFFAASAWEVAQEKCSQFRFAGHDDWSLPTLGEWKTIIDAKMVAPALIEPNPFENVIIHMPYWTSTELINYPARAYAVQLYAGNIHQISKSDLAFVLPVRKVDR